MHIRLDKITCAALLLLSTPALAQSPPPPGAAGQNGAGQPSANKPAAGQDSAKKPEEAAAAKARHDEIFPPGLEPPRFLEKARTDGEKRLRQLVSDAAWAQLDAKNAAVKCDLQAMDKAVQELWRLAGLSRRGAAAARKAKGYSDVRPSVADDYQREIVAMLRESIDLKLKYCPEPEEAAAATSPARSTEPSVGPEPYNTKERVDADAPSVGPESHNTKDRTEVKEAEKLPAPATGERDAREKKPAANDGKKRSADADQKREEQGEKKHQPR